MPGRPCTPEAGETTDRADARCDEHGHQFGLRVDQPDYASPPFRLVWSSCPTRFGNPKGDILRISSATGFILPAPAFPPTRWDETDRGGGELDDPG